MCRFNASSFVVSILLDVCLNFIPDYCNNPRFMLWTNFFFIFMGGCFINLKSSTNCILYVIKQSKC